MNMDDKKLSILVLLDLSAAFDTGDHEILINSLQKCVGLSGSVLDWFRTHLSSWDCFELPFKTAFYPHIVQVKLFLSQADTETLI